MKANKPLIIGLVALLGLSASAIAISSPSNEVDTVYYASATSLVPVGELHVYCTGKHTSWGEQTPYYTIEYTPC